MKVKALLALLGAVAVFAFVSSQAFAATTWTVDQTTGNNLCLANTCKTIGQAVQAAAPGDTILVHPGLYAEHVVVNKQLAIRGTALPPDLQSCNASRTAPNPANFAVLEGGGGGIGFDITASTVTIEGFIIQHFATGIRTSASFSGYSLRTNLIQDNGAGIQLNSNGTANASSNCIRNNPASGILNTSTLLSATIAANLFFQNTFDVNLANGTGTGISVSGNISRSSGFFLLALNVANLSVTGNIVRNPTDAGFFVSGGILLAGANTGFRVTGNIIEDGAASGIVVWGLAGTNSGSIGGNIVSRMRGDGLFVPDGIGFTSMTRTTVTGNIFGSNSDDGIHFELQTVPLTDLTKNTFTGNIAQGNTVHDCHDSNTANTWTPNTNIGKRVNRTGLCFPGSTVTGPQSHAAF